jgi:DNA polymerase III subunit epsilon
MNFTVIDFETANHKRESICAIGIAVVENGKVTKAIEKLVKPTPNYYHSIHTSIHGITAGKTNNKPDFKAIWKEIKPYLHNKKIIAHSAGFDISALKSALDVYNIKHPKIQYYCSCEISKRTFGDLENHQLPTVCEHLGIKLNHHNAKSDAVAAAKIVLGACKANKVKSLKALTEVLELEGKEL